MSIGIILIATGTYGKFFEKFYSSCEKYFIPEKQKTYFLMTDDKNIGFYNNVIKIHQDYEKWPYPTLHRYKYISLHREKFNCKYLFYMDIDMYFVDYINKNILPKKLLAILHPGFYNTHNHSGTPETNEKSSAFIPQKELVSHTYVAGAFQGGKTQLFLSAVETMKNAIDKDCKNGIIPIWHDESIWNKFISVNKKLISFYTPEYCFPENINCFKHIKYLKPKLIAIDKSQINEIFH